MKKGIAVVGVLVSILLLLPGFATADELAERLAVGFQVTPHFSGFSVKYELDQGQTVQPIFYLSATGEDSGTNVVKGTLAVRLLYDLGTKGTYHQYFGWGVGLKTVKETVNGTPIQDDTDYGFQGFIGLETARPGAPLSTSVELSLGVAEDSDASGDGGYSAGFGLGLGMHYHF